MNNDIYFGTYARFDTASKNDAGRLLGADNLVGDIFNIEFITEQGICTAWIKNRFEGLVGFFDEDISRQLSIFEARGWTMKALLSFIAYSETPEPGLYWGEAALVCYDPKEEAFEGYIFTLGKRLAEGNRPEIDLGDRGIEQVIESNGEWKPSKLIPFPKLDPGTVFLKKRRTGTEKLVEQGRKGNKGCYLASMFSFLLVIAAVIFGLRSCGVF